MAIEIKYIFYLIIVATYTIKLIYINLTYIVYTHVSLIVRVFWQLQGRGSKQGHALPKCKNIIFRGPIFKILFIYLHL